MTHKGLRLTFLLLAFVSCNKTDQIAVQPKGYLSAVLRSQEFSTHEMIHLTLTDFPELEQTMLEPVTDLFNFDMRVKVTAISYHTVDPKGDPVLASGIIVQPLGVASRGVVHVPPTTPLSSLEGGSDLLIITEGVFALLGFTVIVPDLIGSGISAYLPQPFLFMNNTGRVCYDMHMAAMEYYDKYTQERLPSHMSIVGYSGGATGAVALLHYIDGLPSSPVTVTNLFAGGGVYDMLSTFQVLKERRYAEYPLTPLLIKSLDYWHALELDYSKVFTGPLLENMDDWLDGTRNARQMKELIDPRLDTYMHPDFFTPEKNPEILKIENALSLHTLLRNWKTKTRIFLGHATDDLSVPFSETQALYHMLKSRSNVSMTSGTGGHYGYGIKFFISAHLYLTIDQL